jgi:hypothetical protein
MDWSPYRDSNPVYQIESLASYPWTIGGSIQLWE